MRKKKIFEEIIVLEKIVGGGQAIGQLASGKKVFVWGGLPGEKVKIQVFKQKSSHAEAVVLEVLEASKERVKAKDDGLYLSTSPWQIMNYDYELKEKSNQIKQAFELSKIDIPNKIEIATDNNEWEYRNKMEYSFWGDDDGLHLAFYRRGTHGKIIVDTENLAQNEITEFSHTLLDLLNEAKIEARDLKTALIRCSAGGSVAAQLYVKNTEITKKLQPLLDNLTNNKNLLNFEIIYSNPKSPASVITEKLWKLNDKSLSDKILGTNFNYSTEGFFQINLPVYEMALKDMKKFIDDNKKTVDLYSGVGTIGLTIGHSPVLVEINEYAVREMRENVAMLDKSAEPVLASAETALDYIKKEVDLIVDPPRAGLHDSVVEKILEQVPQKVIYLSCNPFTQARDTAKLLTKYKIIFQKGYNFFPKTPHIENLIVLEKI